MRAVLHRRCVSSPQQRVSLAGVLLASLAVVSPYSRPVTRTAALRVAVGAASGVLAAPPTSAVASRGAEALRDARGGVPDALLFDTRTRSFLSADPQRELGAALAARQHGGEKPRVVFAGEEHPNAAHHALQLELIKAVDALDDAPTLVGLEMCYREHQPALDDFVFGADRSLATLARRTAWDKTWGFDLALYAPIFEHARAAGIRLCGLNVPYPLVREVSKVGIGGLEPDARALLPNMDLDNREHYRRFGAAMDEAMGAAQPRGEQFSRYYEAMTLWDEYMAASVAGYVRADVVPGAGVGGAANTGAERMVVLAGTGHVRGRVGMPDRFTRRTGLSTFTVVPLESDESWPAVPQPLPTRAEGDWVLYTPPRTENAPQLTARTAAAPDAPWLVS